VEKATAAYLGVQTCAAAKGRGGQGYSGRGSCKVIYESVTWPNLLSGSVHPLQMHAWWHVECDVLQYCTQPAQYPWLFTGFSGPKGALHPLVA
jgi:hypothetical protein